MPASVGFVAVDIKRIRTIAKTVDVPLVRHGGSRLMDNDFKQAIREGISKVNIFTDINDVEYAYL